MSQMKATSKLTARSRQTLQEKWLTTFQNSTVANAVASIRKQTPNIFIGTE